MFGNKKRGMDQITYSASALFQTLKHEQGRICSIHRNSYKRFVHVESVLTDTGPAFNPSTLVFPVSIIPPVFSTHSFVYHRCYTALANETIIH